MFRLLGIETDKKILEYIIQDLDDKSSVMLIELLQPSINDPFILEEDIYDQESAINYCENIHKKIIQDKESKYSQIKKNKQVRLSFLFNIIYENFLPHIGNNFIEKAYYLGLMTKKLLMFKLGLIKETNRDNFNNKRIDLSGGLLASGFRNAFGSFIICPFHNAAAISFSYLYHQGFISISLHCFICCSIIKSCIFLTHVLCCW